MSYDLSIGKQVKERFVNAVAVIANDAQNGQYDQVSAKLNNTLFNGGPFAPKSFSQLISSDPSSDVNVSHMRTCQRQDCVHPWIPDDRFFYLVNIEKKCSFSAVMGYLEAIPGIGTVLAIINAIGHYIGMKSARNALERASLELRQNTEEGSALLKTKEVFAQAMEFTKHRNDLSGSLLSIVPLLKPIARLFQGIIYNNKERAKQPIPQPVVEQPRIIEVPVSSKQSVQDDKFSRLQSRLEQEFLGRLRKRKLAALETHRKDVQSFQSYERESQKWSSSPEKALRTFLEKSCETITNSERVEYVVDKAKAKKTLKFNEYKFLMAPKNENIVKKVLSEMNAKLNQELLELEDAEKNKKEFENLSIPKRQSILEYRKLIGSDDECHPSSDAEAFTQRTSATDRCIFDGVDPSTYNFFESTHSANKHKYQLEKTISRLREKGIAIPKNIQEMALIESDGGVQG